MVTCICITKKVCYIDALFFFILINKSLMFKQEKKNVDILRVSQSVKHTEDKSAFQ